jgi:hypothetical protein
MNHKLLSFIVVAIFATACSTTFKSSQTVDDLYYSPTQLQILEVKDAKQKEIVKNSYDDNFLKHKVKNYSRWSSIDDFNYWNDPRYQFYNNPYQQGFNNFNCYNNNFGNPAVGFNNFYNPSFYNPIYTIVTYQNPPKNNNYTSNSNLLTYTNPKYNFGTGVNSEGKTGVPYSSTPTSNSQTSTPRSNSTGTTWTSPSRSFTPSSTSPASGTSGGNSGGIKSSGTSTSKGR